MTIRSEREKLELQDKELKNDLDAVAQKMLSICNEANASSIKTVQGTVIKKLNERFTLSDRSGFDAFVREHDAIELYEARIHQGNFKEFISERTDEGLPPGVSVMREFTIVVRKPTSN